MVFQAGLEFLKEGDLEFAAILLLLPPECWHYSHYGRLKFNFVKVRNNLGRPGLSSLVWKTEGWALVISWA